MLLIFLWDFFLACIHFFACLFFIFFFSFFIRSGKAKTDTPAYGRGRGWNLQHFRERG